MSDLTTRLVAAIIQRFPSPFRERFGAEMLSAYLDQRDALRARGTASPLSLSRLTIRTVAGLVRAPAFLRLLHLKQLRDGLCAPGPVDRLGEAGVSQAGQHGGDAHADDHFDQRHAACPQHGG